MRISDWSSDVCSSDLLGVEFLVVHQALVAFERAGDAVAAGPFAAVAVGGAHIAVDVEAPVDGRAIGAGAVQRVHVPDCDVAGIEVQGHRARWVDTEVRQVLAVERLRSEEHTSELQSLMRISYAVFCLQKKNDIDNEKT